MPTNINTTITTTVVNSTHVPSTRGLTRNSAEAGVDLEARKSATVLSTASSTETRDSEIQPREPNSTEPPFGNQTEGDDDLPFWAYIIIVFGVIFLVTAVIVILYRRMDRWKNHGSYMVWDDNELELSPAFTRESEFLLDNLAADQEPGTPELQIYEIPLDSLGHQRVYIGTKRVAPKTDVRKELAVKSTKTKKQRKKNKHELHGNTLPRAGRRDHIYSSVNDEASNTLSEGDLREGRNNSGHTFPRLILSNQNLRKVDSSKYIGNGSSSPEDIVREIKTLKFGSRTKSVSNLFQDRPLPPAPSKRFSKSLDRLRFFEAVPHNKGKGKTFPYHQKATPIRAHPVLVKSSSFGGDAYNKIVTGSQPPVPPARKGSIDLLDKSATFGVGHVRKSNLCHRHSKSLDTLLLLRDINWTAYDVDIYHSYASVHSSNSDNNNEKEPSYASVTSDEKPSSHDETSGRISSQSKGSSRSGSPVYSDGPLEDITDENPYASVSDDEMSKTGSLLSGYDPGCSNRGSDVRDSGASSSMLESEDPTSPYASVRISQIPGLDIRSPLGEESNCNEDVFEKEDSGSSIGTCKDLRESEDLKRASTHTYLELLPDSGRDSIISETSSGYARPIDVISDKPDPPGFKGLNSHEESYKSLTDLSIPAGESSLLENSDSGKITLEQSSSAEYSSDKEEKIPLVSDSSANPRDEETESTDSTVRSNHRLSQLSNEGLEEEDEVVARRDVEDSAAPSEVHIYENTDYIQHLRNQDAIEQSKPINSDAVHVQTFGLQDVCLTDEFYA